MNGARGNLPRQDKIMIGLANIDPPEVERLVDYPIARMPVGK